jgi:hypothetical protein
MSSTTPAVDVNAALRIMRADRSDTKHPLTDMLRSGSYYGLFSRDRVVQRGDA